jgi:hypothetical protein
MLGFIARCDNTGLGVESLEFVRHMAPDKMLVAVAKVLRDFPERYASCPDVAFLERPPTPEEADRFLDGLDTLFCIELPYDWSLLERARARDVRIVFRINYEYLPDPLPVTPDVMIAPVDWYQPEEAIVLPFPVNRRRFPFKKRTRAHTFLHVTGRQGRFNRNGTKELLEAIPLVRADVRFVIYSQKRLPGPTDDPRIECHVGDVLDNADLYTAGDVFIFPRRYGGQSLGINEAQSVGMPVMTIDMRPQNAFLPPDLLIPYERMEAIELDRRVECAVIDPVAIASKIDEWAHADISHLSEQADRYADSISWETLQPRYEALCRGRGRTTSFSTGIARRGPANAPADDPRANRSYARV